MPDEPLPDDVAGLRAANARLRTIAEAKDAEIAVPRAGRDAASEREQWLERRLGMDSADSGTPRLKEQIRAKRRAEVEAPRARRDTVAAKGV